MHIYIHIHIYTEKDILSRKHRTVFGPTSTVKKLYFTWNGVLERLFWVSNSTGGRLTGHLLDYEPLR